MAMITTPPGPDGAADLLLVGGTVMTGAGPSRPLQVAIRDGVILDVADDLAARRGAGTEQVDLRGGVVCPGLVDGHSHPVMGLELLDGCDLTTCPTLQEVRAALAAHAAARPDDDWLLAWGLDPNTFGPTAPVASAPLEDALSDRPALIHLFDGHAAIATRAALHRAGISGALALAAGSSVEVDHRGVPTGHLLEEAAVRLVADLIPPASFSARRRQLAELLLRMAATGLTGAHVMDAKGDALDLFTSLDETGELPLRLRVAPWCRPTDDPDEAAASQGRGGRMWEVAGVKLFLDGTIDGGTAWLAEPDAFGESSTPGWDLPTFDDRLRSFDQSGIPVAVHAIGDAAVRHALDALQAIPARGVRHRLEHLETVPDDLLPRFARQGVAVSMQPSHATEYTAADGSDNWSRRLGRDRAAKGWRCADLVRAGAVLVLGSDWPVADFDPRVTLASGVLRRSPGRPAARPVQPEQALTIGEALRACTSAPAWVAGANAGRIAPGFDADLAVFAADPRSVRPKDLPELPVQLTISGGRVRFRTG